MAARLGRAWGLFRPFQQIENETFSPAVEDRPVQVAFVMTWVLLALAPVGAVRLRRSGTPIFPLLAPILATSAAIVLTFGQLRYRAPAEPALALLAAGVLAPSRRPAPAGGPDDRPRAGDDEGDTPSPAAAAARALTTA